MSKTQLTFRFDYSEDGGTTWKESTPKTFTVVDWDLKIPNELLVEHVLEADNEIVRFWAGRITLRLKVDVPNFRPSVDTDNANWLWLQAWIRKPLKRISHDSTEKLDGTTYFASATNTNYVDAEEGNEGEKVNSEFRVMELILQVVKTV